MQIHKVVKRSAFGVQIGTRHAGDTVGAGSYKDEMTAAFSCIARKGEVVGLVFPQCVASLQT
jgi:hypothetical protein